MAEYTSNGLCCKCKHYNKPRCGKTGHFVRRKQRCNSIIAEATEVQSVTLLLTDNKKEGEQCQM